MLIKKACK